MAQDAPRRPLTVEDLWALRRVGAPDATPDGSVIVVPVTAYDMETNASSTRLYRVFLDGREPLPLTAADAFSTEPAVSPDGSRLAFVRRDKAGLGQLAVLSLAGGEAEVLTDFPLGILDPRWFPDGRRLAFVGWVLAAAPTPPGTRELLARREKDPVRAHVTEDRIYRYWDGWLTDGRVPHVFVFDLASRAVQDLIPDSRRWFDLMDPKGCYDIAPDGSEIAFSADRSDPPHSPTNWDIFVVGTSGGEVQNLTLDNPGDDVRPRYSPDGRHILYGMQRSREFYADRVRLVTVERATGHHEVLTEGWDRSAVGWEWSRRGGDLLLTAEDEARMNVFRTVPAVKDPVLVRRGGTYSDLRPLHDGSFLALRQDLSRPPEVVHVAAGGGEETRLTGFNDALLSGIAMGEVREIFFPGSEGRRIQAFVGFPPGFTPERKWPLLEVLHGGPHNAMADQFHFRWNLQLLAAGGHVVLAPNFHGSTGWGQEFAACIQGAWGEKPYRDAMAAVDALLAEGFIDEKRMAAAGGSYGGYLVAWIAGHTDRFACLISHAGISDTLSEYASDITHEWALALGGAPWEGLAGLDRMNPVRFARGFRSPMLVLHGERDFRVPAAQGLVLYNVYRAKGVPARLVYFPDENHNILKPRNARLWHREFQAWLDRWFAAAG